jgi:hypothetical protein
VLRAVLAPINRRSVRTAQLTGSSANHPQFLAGVVRRGSPELNGIHATSKELNVRNFLYTLNI